MKKPVALALCLLLLAAVFGVAAAEEPVSLRLLLVTNTNYNIDAPLADSIYRELEKRLNLTLNIEWIASEGAKEKLSTLLASQDVPDLFSASVDVPTLVGEGAIVALDDYADKIPNYLKWLEGQEANAYSALDGKLYAAYHYTDYKPAYTMVVRKDWLDKLGLEKAPETIDEWIDFWRMVRDEDLNGNGDPNDEIPFVDPSTFTAGRNAASLLTSFGIKSNGTFYKDDSGRYSLVQEHERYADYLTLMRQLYAEKLLDQEVFTHTATDVAKLFNSDIAASGYQWTSRPQNTTKTLREMGNALALLVPVTPVKGEAQLIPHRNALGGTFVVGYQTETNGKLEAVLKLIDYLYGEEGIQLMNWGIEGVHHAVVDGKIVLNADIVGDSTFITARHAGLVQQVFPGVWTRENYDTIMTKGMALEQMEIWDQQMVLGSQINWDYYFTMPITLSTEAWSEYSGDIMTKLEELRAGCITGQITVEAFFAGYEALKPFGLQAIVDQAQEAYDRTIH